MFENLQKKDLEKLIPLIRYESTDSHFYISLLHKIQNVGVHYSLCKKLEIFDLVGEIPQLIEILLQDDPDYTFSHPIYDLLYRKAMEEEFFKVSLILRLQGIKSSLDEEQANICKSLITDIIQFDNSMHMKTIYGVRSKLREFSRRNKYSKFVYSKIKSSINDFDRKISFDGLFLYFLGEITSTLSKTAHKDLSDYCKVFCKVKHNNTLLSNANTTFQFNTTFLNTLARISSSLKFIPITLRNLALTIELEILNNELRTKKHPFFVFEKTKKVVNFLPEYSKTMDSCENCPYLVIIEVVDDSELNDVFNKIKSYRQGQSKYKKSKVLLKQLDTLNELGDVGDLNGIRESILKAIQNILLMEDVVKCGKNRIVLDSPDNNINSISDIIGEMKINSLEYNTVSDNIVCSVVENTGHTISEDVCEQSVNNVKQCKDDFNIVEIDVIDYDIIDDEGQSVNDVKECKDDYSIFENNKKDYDCIDDEDQSNVNGGKECKDDSNIVENNKKKSDINNVMDQINVNDKEMCGKDDYSTVENNKKDSGKILEKQNSINRMKSYNDSNIVETDHSRITGDQISINLHGDDSSVTQLNVTDYNMEQNSINGERSFYDYNVVENNETDNENISEGQIVINDNKSDNEDYKIVEKNGNEYNRLVDDQININDMKISCNDSNTIQQNNTGFNNTVKKQNNVDNETQYNSNFNFTQPNETDQSNIKDKDDMYSDVNYNGSSPTLKFDEVVEKPEDVNILKSEVNEVYVDKEILIENRENLFYNTKENIRKNSKYSHIKGWDVKSFIVKSGGIIKQEYVAFQFLTQMKEIFIIENLPIYIKNYQIFLISDTAGLIETVIDSISIHRIKSDLKFKNLNEYFLNSFKEPNLSKAKKNFLYSLVGYSLASYLLQIKDRHNGNILVDKFGHLIHVDFGFIFGKYPGIISVETAPFKLSTDFLDLIDLEEFKALFFQGFKALRKHKDKLLRLVEIMDGTGYCDKGTYTQLTERLRLFENERELEIYCQWMVQKSIKSMGTIFYDQIQYYSNGYL